MGFPKVSESRADTDQGVIRKNRERLRAGLKYRNIALSVGFPPGARSLAVYRYREHPVLELAQMNAAKVTYFERAALWLETVTLTIPPSRRVKF